VHPPSLIPGQLIDRCKGQVRRSTARFKVADQHGVNQADVRTDRILDGEKVGGAKADEPTTF